MSAGSEDEDEEGRYFSWILKPIIGVAAAATQRRFDYR